MSKAAEINPELFKWARETAGLSLEEAAVKLGLKNTDKATAAEKLRAIEAGRQPVSEGRLQKAASVYRRPLVSFYLPQRPSRGERGEDFRIVSAAVSVRDNALLDTLMRDVRARQQMLREVLIDDEEVRPLSFVASARIEHGASKVAAAVRHALGITKEQQRAAKGPASLFALLRAAAEQIGVYVLLLGDLGSHHSDISEAVFRGFALADDIAPFVVINDNDAVTARAFTLMHELAHIWIGASGVSGPLSSFSENAIEKFCNTVAGEFLLPPEAVAAVPNMQGVDLETVLRTASQIADAWNVSEGVVTYRFLRDDRITQGTAGALFNVFRERWRRERQRSKEAASDSSGPTYYIVRRHRLGAALLGVVRRAIQEEALTHTRAAKILGVSPSSIDQLLQERIRVA